MTAEFYSGLLTGAIIMAIYSLFIIPKLNDFIDEVERRLRKK